MAFDALEASTLLARCHRRCCICHRFCGVKMELDHIMPRAERGTDNIENAIPVCFECHAEIHLYNDQHPRGRKFRPEELQRHKKQWLDLCDMNPVLLVENPRATDVGPLQSLIDELELNETIVAEFTRCDALLPAPFAVMQFERAIERGLVSILRDAVKTSLLGCYAHLRACNTRLSNVTSADNRRYLDAFGEAKTGYKAATDRISVAKRNLMRFLADEATT